MFLLWARARNENDELRRRLAKYEPPKQPAPPSAGGHVGVAIFISVLIGLLIIANTATVPGPAPGEIPVPTPRPTTTG